MNAKLFLFFRIVIAVVLFQTLYFKFTGHPDSVYIFSKINLEPVGRIGIGVLELLAGILILTRRYSWAGALMTFAMMGGAIGMHLNTLGIVIKDDNGLLFGLAVLLLVLSSIVLIAQRKAIPIIGKLL